MEEKEIEHVTDSQIFAHGSLRRCAWQFEVYVSPFSVQLENIVFYNLFIECCVIFNASCTWRGGECSYKDFDPVFTDHGMCYAFNNGGHTPLRSTNNPGIFFVILYL